ncbi:MAG: alpha/beta hydrolase [Umezawaea sp.]
MPAFHPDLAVGRFLPPITHGPRLLTLLSRMPVRGIEIPDDILVDDVLVPGADGAPDVFLRIYRPRSLRTAAPALFWIHGGGFILGHPFQDEAANISFARTLGITVAAVRYRLGPKHPSPAAIEDAYAALSWLFAHAEERLIDPTRIAVGGASAGGGLAAGLVLYAHDRGEVQPAFQLLVYPMLDDRTVLRTDMNTRHVRVWTPGSNRYAWTSYLGATPGAPDVSPYAAPARRADLTGLPPAWIGVGTLDLFHDEDLAYADRLQAAGVPCEVVTVPGAFHGFDGMFRRTRVVADFRAAQTKALRTALFRADRA